MSLKGLLGWLWALGSLAAGVWGAHDMGLPALRDSLLLLVAVFFASELYSRWRTGDWHSGWIVRRRFSRGWWALVAAVSALPVMLVLHFAGLV